MDTHRSLCPECNRWIYTRNGHYTQHLGRGGQAHCDGSGKPLTPTTQPQPERGKWTIRCEGTNENYVLISPSGKTLKSGTADDCEDEFERLVPATDVDNYLFIDGTPIELREAEQARKNAVYIYNNQPPSKLSLTIMPKPELILNTEDSPLANNRQPVTGDVMFGLRFPLDDGRELVIQMGRRGMDTLSDFLIDYMSDHPSFGDGSTNQG